LVQLLSPILAFTTDEMWGFIRHLPGIPAESPMFAGMPTPNPLWQGDETMQKYSQILQIRADVNKALETARNDKLIGSSMEADVSLYFSAEAASDLADLYQFLSDNSSDLSTLFIVSSVDVRTNVTASILSENFTGLSIHIRRAEGEKCVRCWNIRKDIGSVAQHPELCRRCADVVIQNRYDQ
jgi:isoleucyl-tRNA synthetase